MKRTALLGMVLLFLLPGPAQAEPKRKIGLKTVIAALETPFRGSAPAAGHGVAKIIDFEGSFSQRSHLASLDRVQLGQGTVAFKFAPSGPGRKPAALFRWKYEKPNKQLIVSDGKTLWVYLPENEQVVESDIRHLSRRQASDPVTFLSALGNLSRDFAIRFASPRRDAKGNYVLELTPRHPSPLIRRLLLVVDEQAVLAQNRKSAARDVFPLISSTVYDANADSTTIEFNHIRVNGGIPDSLFHFTPPPGVEVVHPTKNGLKF